MEKVRVIAVQGAVLRGPMKVTLTKKQHELRAHVLGKWKSGGRFELDGGQELSFKRGEELGVELEDTKRLNRQIFAWDEPEVESGDDTAPSGGGSDTLSEGDDSAPGGDGSDSVAGGEDTTPAE